MEAPLYEPFVGLSYDGVHSSTLGLYRVSDGSRYNEDLLPSFSDKTAERTGADGMYYFGSDYQQKNWSIEFAFDHITEEQLNKIKRLFGKGVKQPLKLVFDEDLDWTEVTGPATTEELSINKYYMAKVVQPPQLKTLCFDEEDKYGNMINIYKGELTVELTNVSAFGYGEQEEISINGGKFSCINLEVESFPTFIFDNLNKDKLFADNKVGIRLNLPSKYIEAEKASIYTIILEIQIPSTVFNHENNKDTGLYLDFENGLIYGFRDGVKTTNIYNQYIYGGFFFSIPAYSEPESDNTIQINCDSSFDTEKLIFQKRFY